MPFVAIMIGSKSDWSIMKECVLTLKRFGVKYEIIISSAHRTPIRTKDYVLDCLEKGAEVFIGAAGMAAHLAGAIAAITCKPVIAVPLSGGAIDGLDALLSSVQMPKAMPVGTVSIGKAGAINAAYLAMQILAINDKNLADKLMQDREDYALQIEKDTDEINREIEVLK